jgi:site-specific DNA recombinase
LQRYAALQNAEIEIFEDAGISGRREDRPALTCLLSEIDRFDALAIARLDRLGRSTRQLLDITDDVYARDVRLVSLTESIDTATATGRLMRDILAALASFESERVGERLAEVSERRAREGRPHGGPAPYGHVWATTARAPDGSSIPSRRKSCGGSCASTSPASR